MAERPLPDLLLERYRLGELPEERLREINRRLADDPELRIRLERLRASDEALLREHAPEVTARRLQDRLRRERVEAELRREGSPNPATAAKKAPAWLGVWGRPAFAGALFLALVSVPVWQTWKPRGASVGVDERSAVLPGAGASPAAAPEDGGTEVNTLQANEMDRAAGEGESRARAEEASAAPQIAATPVSPDDVRPDTRMDTRLKGLEPGLALFRKTAEGSEPLRPGAKARPGDVLRIGYRATDGVFGAIYSVDGHGNVTRHWPPDGDRAVRLEPGEHLLPGAFELDAAPEYERFYLWVSDRAFALPPVSEALKSGRVPVAGDGIRVLRFDLLKDFGT